MLLDSIGLVESKTKFVMSSVSDIISPQEALYNSRHAAKENKSKLKLPRSGLEIILIKKFFKAREKNKLTAEKKKPSAVPN